MNLVLKELLEKLKTAFGETFRHYYTWDLKVFPENYLPILMIFGNSTNVKARGTVADQVVYNITVRMVVDTVAYAKEGDAEDIIQHQIQLSDWAEGRDPETKQYLAQSVLGVLRHKDNLRGKYYYYDDDAQIKYHVIPGAQVSYMAVDVTFSATTDLINRPGY